MLNLNGKIIPSSEISENRGLQYADAVFETIKVSAGKILFWEDHYFRLMASMRILRMEIPMNFTMEFLEEEIEKTIASQENSSHAYRIKLLVWRKAGGKYTPQTRDVEYFITVESLSTPFYTLDEQPYTIELFKDHYVNSGLLSTLKSTGRTINVLGSIFAEENDYSNCLLLNENKQVIEALNGNVFLVNGYKIKTPPLADGCLNGILRKQIIDILGQLPDYILEEASVSPFELQKADEIFITNTILGIQPVTKYRKKEYTNTVAKELLAKLNVKARLG
ncbi:branched-chain amino acid aminotransferase [Ulvibacter sp. MAR_2010_11]|uniref:aminotransferase class IV n=1 Tax=Ulvibacter sp. MAR_2010_11 TaxID=1250229 RepID=UPI000C2CBE2B|nr:aminotransferase class IV [Ulvibacter sp. MAR_2010_11]PKA83978.1 branched-chain amino acid aminotransferase [Ulvibacter sp. MAR_2010_11]